MKLKKQMKVFVGITAALFMVFAMAPTASMAKLPKLMTITCYPIGSTGTVLTTAFSAAIEKMTGIRCRPTPADADMARLLPVKRGEAQAMVITASTTYQASNGVEDFSKKMWGPQRIRYVFGGNVIQHGMGVKVNSGIKTWADLKGKRVCLSAGVAKMSIPGFLAYGGLTKEDVVLVPAGGYMHAIKTVMSGGADACHLCPSSPISKEWEAAPYGLRYLPMSKDDTAAWDRMRKYAPFMASPIWTTTGARGEGGDKWLAYYPYTISTYDTVPEDQIYTIVKVMDQGRDLYKDVKRPESEQWTMEISLDLTKPVYIPFHPGFIRYAKEKGMWKAEHEAFQANALKEEEARIKAWKAKK
jgi:TRAP transporter TAXI family solute receptor